MSNMCNKQISSCQFSAMTWCSCDYQSKSGCNDQTGCSLGTKHV